MTCCIVWPTVPLVDAYTAYQVLDDSWQKTIANDLETIQS